MLIIGIGGLCKDMLQDMLEQYKPEDLLFYTEYENDPGLPFFKSLKDIRVTCSLEEVKAYFNSTDRKFLALIADNRKRKAMVEKMEKLGGEPHYYISNKAMASTQNNRISTRNVIIMMFSSVGADSTISEGVILYTYSGVAHDSTIGEYAFIAPYSCGSRFSVGSFSFVGTHANILPGISIGSNSIIGNGAIVTKDVPDNSLAYGIPAVLKQKKTS